MAAHTNWTDEGVGQIARCAPGATISDGVALYLQQGDNVARSVTQVGSHVQEDVDRYA
jgi:hypothetical protein